MKTRDFIAIALGAVVSSKVRLALRIHYQNSPIHYWRWLLVPVFPLSLGVVIFLLINDPVKNPVTSVVYIGASPITPLPACIVDSNGEFTCGAREDMPHPVAQNETTKASPDFRTITSGISGSCLRINSDGTLSSAGAACVGPYTLKTSDGTTWNYDSATK